MEKSQIMNKANKSKQIIENFLIVGVMSIFSFIFLLLSPLHPWLGDKTGTDSSVFQTVALMMEKGYMPYKDTFDHKGPLLYIIQYIGRSFSENHGIWLMEFLSLVITFMLIYKISRMRCSINISVIVFLISTFVLFQYFQGGNYTEEYAMPMISLAVYIFMDYLINGKISGFRLVTCGFSFGCVLLLRPNMISVWLVFCIWILLDLIIRKEWKILINYIVFFSIGVALIVLPIIIWLAVNHSLVECYEDYIVFNRQYISPEGGRALFSAKWNSFFVFFNSTSFLISIGIILYKLSKKERKCNIPYLLCLFISLLFICLSGMAYGHYGMVLVPLYAYPVSLLFEELEKIEPKYTAKVIIMIVSVFCLSNLVLPNWLTQISSVASIYENRGGEHRPEVALKIKEIVENTTEDDDAISVYGNWDYIYVICDRKHATRYSYQFPIGQVMPQIMDEYYKQLQEEQPKVIVVQGNRYDEKLANFLETNAYSIAWSENGESLDGALVYVLN